MGAELLAVVIVLVGVLTAWWTTRPLHRAWRAERSERREPLPELDGAAEHDDTVISKPERLVYGHSFERAS